MIAGSLVILGTSGLGVGPDSLDCDRACNVKSWLLVSKDFEIIDHRFKRFEYLNPFQLHNGSGICN